MSLQPFETNYTVRGYDCNYGGPLKPLALANFFQESAGDHATIIGLGMEAMVASGHTWMLSRIDIEIENLPREGDVVTVRTWPAGNRRVFAIRYLELLTADGHRLAGALYDYIIIDLSVRKIVRPEHVVDATLKLDRAAPYDDLAPGLQDVAGFSPAPPDGWDRAYSMEVGHRHIDNNGHVNNAHFVDWLCDAVPPEGRATGIPSRVKVDFVSEVVAGESITAWSKGDLASGGQLSALTRGDAIVARALTRWR